MKKERFVARIFSSLRDKKIRFTPRSISNQKPFSSEKIEVKEEDFVNLHTEIAQKVDALIVANEREQLTEELEFTPADKVDLNPERLESSIHYNI